MVAPRRRTRRARTTADAITLAVGAVAKAASKNKGINQEITFPGGRLVVMIGAITLTELVVADTRQSRRKTP